MRAMFGTILLAVDGSDHAERATKLAAAAAAKGGDEVVVVHIVEILASMAGAAPAEPPDEATMLVDRYVKQLEATGVTARGDVPRARSGHVAQQLVQAADACQAGIIVMGSRGMTDLSSLLLGSVTHKVLHLASCPVLVTR
jgi:nucleotide-binding universal stress UspA family protein